jgi:hypothetical protein
VTVIFLAQFCIFLSILRGLLSSALLIGFQHFDTYLAFADTRAHTHARTRARTHAHAHARARTHTHTHARRGRQTPFTEARIAEESTRILAVHREYLFCNADTDELHFHSIIHAIIQGRDEDFSSRDEGV